MGDRYCLRRLQDRTLDEETFLEYYRESNWAKPMLAEALEQFEATVREKRNDFLLNSVQVRDVQYHHWCSPLETDGLACFIG